MVVLVDLDYCATITWSVNYAMPNICVVKSYSQLLGVALFVGVIEASFMWAGLDNKGIDWWSRKLIQGFGGK